MATKTLKKVNVVTIGVGFTGGIVAAECARAGLTVVGLERGEKRSLADFQEMHDEWRYAVNYGLMQDLSKETVTFRNDRNMKALPMRRLGSFLLGAGLGGAGLHWNGVYYRFFPYDFQIKTLTAKRYGANKLSKDYQLQDWPLTYDQMEPYYTRFEKVIGVSGESASPFDGKRSEPFPLPPMPKTTAMKLFEKATKQIGCHPFMIAAGIATNAYTNPYGMQLNPCMFCGFCERFACEYDAKASPNNTVLPAAIKTGNYELRCNANVVEILKKGNKVTGVRYINTLTMEECIQPADIVVATSYVMNNAKLLMVSKIGKQYDPATGKGTLGKGYCYQITPGTTGFFKNQTNTYAGAGALAMGIDDFNADNFDHSGLDFIHGAVLAIGQYGKRPIETNAVPPGTPGWGAAFKKASIENFTRTLAVGGQGSSMPHKENYFSLDDTYRDAYGLPLLRLTYNFTAQDRAMFAFMTTKTEQIMKEMGATTIASKPNAKDYTIVPYQTTHNTGGTIMGASPADSVVNSYLQHWDAHNLFVVGAGNFPHNSGRNPTGTVGALAYRCAEGILKYAKKEGSLV